MKVKDKISYYCFNKKCNGSVYFHNSVKVTDMPFTEKTLTGEHHCSLCCLKLVSVIDIELRQALSFTKPAPALPACKLNV